MKKVFSVFILVAVAISACSPVPTLLPVPSPTSIEVTAPSPTQTPEPTATQIPSPTQILNTPTLDVSRLVTFTLSAPAQCPATVDGKKLSMGYILQNPESTPDQITNSILEFLNNGGTLKAAYDGLDKGTEEIKAFVVDLTNDGVSELILQRSPYLFIFGCDANNYKIIHQITDKYGEIYVYALQDYNLNGVPEIIFRRNDRVFTIYNQWYSYHFLEWNGHEFQNILTESELSEDGLDIDSQTFLKMPGVRIVGKSITTDAENRNTWEVADYDNNGLQDIRIVGGLPTTASGEPEFPSRQTILTLSWNGKEYIPSKIVSKAIFRIDIARDADLAFLQGNYERALLLYFEAIQNDKLIDWENFSENEINYFTARKRMQAYSYYRMLLTHVVQGNLDDALEDYRALQNQFSNDDEAVSSYAILAVQFWNNFQATQNIASSCAQVISYVEDNQEVLLPFTTTLDKDYEPKDLCPVE